MVGLGPERTTIRVLESFVHKSLLEGYEFGFIELAVILLISQIGTAIEMYISHWPGIEGQNILFGLWHQDYIKRDLRS